MTNDRIVPPLFPAEEGKKQVFADEIRILKIYRQILVPGGKTRRVLIPSTEYALPSGEEFKYNPFETTENDIAKFFGGGEFFLEPIGDNFKLLPGRGLNIDAPRRGAAAALDARAAVPQQGQQQYGQQGGIMPDDPSQSLFSRARNPFDEPESPMKNVLDSQREMTGMVRDVLTDRATVAEAQAGRKEETVSKLQDKLLDLAIGQRSGPNDATNPMIDSLRRQIEELHTRHTDEIRRLREESDRERARIQRDADEERSRQRTERERVERDHDTLRRKNDDDVRDLRTRYDRDLEDIRKRYERQITEDADRASRKYKDLEKEFEETKSKLTKQVYELEKENLELTRELASIPEPPENGEGGGGGGGGGPGLPEDAPWWAAMIPDIVKTVAEVRQGGAAAMEAARQQQLESQQPQQQLPAPRQQPQQRQQQPVQQRQPVPQQQQQQPQPQRRFPQQPPPAPAAPPRDPRAGVSPSAPSNRFDLIAPDPIVLQPPEPVSAPPRFSLQAPPREPPQAPQGPQEPLLEGFELERFDLH